MVCQISCIYSSTAWWSMNKLNTWESQGCTSQRYVQRMKKAQETFKDYQRTVTLSLYTVCTSLKVALAVMDHSLWACQAHSDTLCICRGHIKAYNVQAITGWLTREKCDVKKRRNKAKNIHFWMILSSGHPDISYSHLFLLLGSN